MNRLDLLGRLSEEPTNLTRTFGSPAMRRANDLVARWMRQAGLLVREDIVGNLIGHYPAASPKLNGTPFGSGKRKVLLLGSHLDTVRNAGKYDGALGVLLALACVEQLARAGVHLPFDIEVVGFADEEGVRFQTACLGSRALAGRLTPADLARQDANRISLADAIRRFTTSPQNPRRDTPTLTPSTRSPASARALHAALKQTQLDPARLFGYVEVHIEQGPVLEQKGFAVGVVSGIAGQSRYQLTFRGHAGHAGTTPMRARHDALCAAAEFLLAAEKRARQTHGLVATVGQIQVQPNASNVIPGETRLTLDVRHLEDAIRRASAGALAKAARRIAAARRVKVLVDLVQETPSVPCSRRFSGLLQHAVRQHQTGVPVLPSGAGHDAAVLANLTPVAMLFVRCRGGLSHHPDEAVKTADVRTALAVMETFLKSLNETTAGELRAADEALE